MATLLAVKRMARERKELETPNPDYFVFFQDDDDLLHFDAYILGPEDTLYAHKLVKVHFDIPHNYPIVPPKVTFIQHTGGRIHPNLYVEGKVCLSILSTFPGEPWAQAMKIDSVLITIRSLLDNQPYKHEPGGRDDPSYNKYVQYVTWRFLLLDYLEREANAPARIFLERHMRENGGAMLQQLTMQQQRIKSRCTLRSRYGGPKTETDFARLRSDVERHISRCFERSSGSNTAPHLDSPAESTSAVTNERSGIVLALENPKVRNKPIANKKRRLDDEEPVCSTEKKSRKLEPEVIILD